MSVGDKLLSFGGWMGRSALDDAGQTCRVQLVELSPPPGGAAPQAVTIADGGDTAEGATTAPAYSDNTGASAGTVVGLLKGAYVALRGLLTGQTSGTQLTRLVTNFSPSMDGFTYAHYLVPPGADPNSSYAPLAVQQYVQTPAGSSSRAPGDGTGAWVHAPQSAPTDGSGTIAASGGTAQVVFTSTTQGEFINSGTAVLWARWGAAAAVNGQGSFPINPGSTYVKDRVTGTLNLLSTAANATYTFTKFG